jgi:hypothetical protein
MLLDTNALTNKDQKRKKTNEYLFIHNIYLYYGWVYIITGYAFVVFYFARARLFHFSFYSIKIQENCIFFPQQTEQKTKHTILAKTVI